MGQKSTEKSKTKEGVFRKACDVCRRKKTRCEWLGEICEECLRFDTECKVSLVEKKRGPRRPPGHKRIAELEERLRKAENASKTAAVINQRPIGDETNLIESSNNSSVRALESDELHEPNLSQITPASFQENIGYSTPSANFQINSSALSIPNYHQHSETNGSELITTDWKTSAINDVFPRRTIKQLPLLSEAVPLMQEAFRNFSAAFPIFDPVHFFRRVEDEYTQDICEDIPWWACLNIVLALAHRFRAMRLPFQQQENWLAWSYMQNALSVLAELSLLSNSLSTVQAMLGMAIILQGTPNPRPCASLIATTIKLAQTMGLHRNEFLPHLTFAEIEERKKVFWVLYWMDKDISLRTGQPPTHDDDDMDVEFPVGVASVTDEGPSFLMTRIKLALIQGQIYKRLCSIKARRQPFTKRLAAAQELDILLSNWFRTTPANFQDGSGHGFSTIVHALIIRFIYFNCLYTIHQVDPDYTYNQNILQTEDFQAEPRFVTEARNSIKLLQMVPLGDFAYVWLLLHYFCQATVSLLQKIIKSPAHIFVQSDLESVQPVVMLFKQLGKNGDNAEVQALYEMCDSLEQAAVDSIHKETQRNSHIQRSDNRTNESIDEFIQRIEAISSGKGDNVLLMYET